MSRTTLVFTLLVAFVAAPARAGHALDEPPSLAKLVHGATRAELAAALPARCAVDDGSLADAGLRGVECRAGIAAALVHARGTSTKAGVEAHTTLIADLGRAAASVSSWEPLVPPPDLSRARFDAHQAIARAIMALYDDVVAAGPQPTLKDTACTAVSRSVTLGTGADARADETGALRSLLTSHACFLDESRIASHPTPGSALQKSADAASIAASTSAKAVVADYAASRKLDVERCTDRHVNADGTADDKLSTCACGAMQRWKFPALDQDVDAVVPLTVRLGVRVSVSKSGALGTCGPIVTSPP